MKEITIETVVNHSYISVGHAYTISTKTPTMTDILSFIFILTVVLYIYRHFYYICLLIS